MFCQRPDSGHTQWGLELCTLHMGGAAVLHPLGASASHRGRLSPLPNYGEVGGE